MPRRVRSLQALLLVVVGGAGLLAQRAAPPAPAPAPPVDETGAWRPLDAAAAQATKDVAVARLRDVEQRLPRVQAGFIWYARTVPSPEGPGERRAVHLRRATTPGAPEQVVLDERALAQGRERFVLGALEPSPDGRLLAYSFDDGDGAYDLYVKDLATGALVVDGVPDTDFSLAWDASGRVLYYAVLDEALRPYEVRALPVQPAAQPAAPRVVVKRAQPDVEVSVARAADDDVAIFVERRRSLLAYRLAPEAGGVGALPLPPPDPSPAVDAGPAVAAGGGVGRPTPPASR